MKKQSNRVIPATLIGRPFFIIKPERKSRKERILALLIEIMQLVSK